MIENDVRKQAKASQTHLTPEKLRVWFGEKVGDVKELTVFDPAVGSGQLLQYIEAKHFIGNDIDKTSLDYFKNNFKNADCFNENYFDIENIEYDVAVANYPFSLALKDVIDYEKEHNKKLIDIFFKNGKITGKADYLFILKSFLQAKQKRGYYLCFPGITYRTAEQKFRDYITENNFLISYGQINNCKFDSTSINILYLELGENKTGKVDTFLYDLQQDKILKSVEVDIKSLIGKSWEVPREDIEEEIIDIEELEKKIEATKIKRRMIEDELDAFLKELKNE
jgi:hypothetical protein